MRTKIRLRKDKNMKKSEKAKELQSKPKSSKSVQASSYTIRHDPEHVASVIIQQFSYRERCSIVRILSAQITPQSSVRVDLCVGGDISALYEGLRWSELRVSGVPQWTMNVIESGVWRHRMEELLGHIVEFNTFREFIETPPPMGMGSTLEKLRDICSGSEEALRMIDQAVGE